MDKYTELIKKIAKDYYEKKKAEEELESKKIEIAKKYEETVMEKARIDNRILDISYILSGMQNLDQEFNRLYTNEKIKLLQGQEQPVAILLAFSLTLIFTNQIPIGIGLIVGVLSEMGYSLATTKKKISKRLQKKYESYEKSDLQEELTDLRSYSRELGLVRESLANVGNLTEEDLKQVKKELEMLESEIELLEAKKKENVTEEEMNQAYEKDDSEVMVKMRKKYEALNG